MSGDNLIPAATVLLLRDGSQGPEVFMVQRHHRIDFATGALVFPGGKVDKGDVSAAVMERCPGIGSIPAPMQSFRIAALREAFEESGILLARRKGSEALLTGAEVRNLYDWRKRLETREVALGAFLDAENLLLECESLLPYAHWITPEGMPKRFDTHFFISVSPEGHDGAHDGRESVDSVWIRPEEALADAEAGKRQIIFPTRMNLALLTGHDDCAAILQSVREREIVTVLPKVRQDGSRMLLKIPFEAGYPVSEEVFDPEKER